MNQTALRVTACVLGILAGYGLHSAYGGRFYTSPHGGVLDGMTGTLTRGNYVRVEFDPPKPTMGLNIVERAVVAVGDVVDPAPVKNPGPAKPEPPRETRPPLTSDEAKKVEQFERMALASRDRGLALYPVFADAKGAARKRLDAYVSAQLNRPERADFFSDPYWPELIMHEFVDLTAAEERAKAKR